LKYKFEKLSKKKFLNKKVSTKKEKCTLLYNKVLKSYKKVRCKLDKIFKITKSKQIYFKRKMKGEKNGEVSESPFFLYCVNKIKNNMRNKLFSKSTWSVFKTRQTQSSFVHYNKKAGRLKKDLKFNLFRYKQKLFSLKLYKHKLLKTRRIKKKI